MRRRAVGVAAAVRRSPPRSSRGRPPAYRSAPALDRMARSIRPWSRGLGARAREVQRAVEPAADRNEARRAQVSRSRPVIASVRSLESRRSNNTVERDAALARAERQAVNLHPRPENEGSPAGRAPRPGRLRPA